MAELLARNDNLEGSAQIIWRKTLPAGRDVTIGRRPNTDLGAPEWNRSDWVVDDPRAHGRHVIIRWDGSVLRVRRREPFDRPAINPVLYRGKSSDDFTLRPGESFIIGSTSFTLQVQDTESHPMTMSIARDELRRNEFLDANKPLLALADLPEIIRNSHDDAQLEERVLEVILKGLTLADFAAFVMLDPHSADARAAITRSKHRSLSEDQHAISQRLVRYALRDTLESVLFLWDQKTDLSFSATSMPNTDWAICTPLGDNAEGRALYVAGRVHRNIHSEELLRRDTEFKDHQKFVNLVSDLYCSMSALRLYQSRYEQMRRFLPRPVVEVLAKQNLDEKLKPRIAEVTALFCDLRGSCKHVQDTTDMLDSWKQMSLALDIMTSAIDANGGVIGGLQGDAAVGFWGWPDSAPEQIEHAVRTAQQIRREFAKNQEFRSSFRFQCGIGIAHGAAVVGRLGVYDQFKLDAYGPVMNLASRLESMTKHFGVQIRVDDAIAKYLKANDSGTNRARLRRLAKVRPVGITTAVEISELMPSDLEESNIPYNQWEVGIKSFIEGNWANARKRLQLFLNALPKSRATQEKAGQVILQFMERTKDVPPPGWDGVIPLEVK